MLSAPCTVYDCTVGELFAHAEKRETALAAMLEAYAIGKARGINFSFDDPVAYATAFAEGIPNANPSMRLDHLAGRRSEIDAINGMVPLLGAETGIATPVNSRLSAECDGARISSGDTGHENHWLAWRHELESTRTYYNHLNTIIRDQMGGLHSARVMLNSVDFAPLEEMMRRGDWEVEKTLITEAERLKLPGLKGLLCTNTMHKVAPQLEAAIGISFPHC